MMAAARRMSTHRPNATSFLLQKKQEATPPNEEPKVYKPPAAKSEMPTDQKPKQMTKGLRRFFPNEEEIKALKKLSKRVLTEIVVYARAQGYEEKKTLLKIMRIAQKPLNHSILAIIRPIVLRDMANRSIRRIFPHHFEGEDDIPKKFSEVSPRGFETRGIKEALLLIIMDSKTLVSASAPGAYASQIEIAASNAMTILVNCQVYLGRTDFSGIRIPYCDLDFAMLQSANLSNANLTGVQIAMTYFQNAKLDGALMREADFGINRNDVRNKLLSTGHHDPVDEIISPSECTGLFITKSKTALKVWATHYSTLIQTYKVFSGHCSTVACSPNAQQVALNHGDNIEVWEILKSKHTKVGGDQKSRIHHLVFSPDGSKIASGNEDQTVTVYEISSGKLCNTYMVGGDITVMLWHGAFLIVQDKRGHIRVWDYRKEGELVRNLEPTNLLLLALLPTTKPGSLEISAPSMLLRGSKNLILLPLSPENPPRKLADIPSGAKVCSSRHGQFVIIYCPQEETKEETEQEKKKGTDGKVSSDPKRLTIIHTKSGMPLAYVELWENIKSINFCDKSLLAVGFECGEVAVLRLRTILGTAADLTKDDLKKIAKVKISCHDAKYVGWGRVGAQSKGGFKGATLYNVIGLKPHQEETVKRQGAKTGFSPTISPEELIDGHLSKPKVQSLQIGTTNGEGIPPTPRKESNPDEILNETLNEIETEQKQDFVGFEIGTKVKVYGLRSVPRFNGKTGRILSALKNGRHAVKLDDNRKLLSVKLQNLKSLEPAPEIEETSGKTASTDPFAELPFPNDNYTQSPPLPLMTQKQLKMWLLHVVLPNNPDILPETVEALVLEELDGKSLLAMSEEHFRKIVQSPRQRELLRTVLQRACFDADGRGCADVCGSDRGDVCGGPESMASGLFSSFVGAATMGATALSAFLAVSAFSSSK
eukprot:CAMPEP_0167750632 /NCGR_PEP_ID=MMETSP0110_2-20121227/6102_1 /TAXON_ID=629695 /ORGANISM="Gymnochlora sp., Strain CCMP2014" /LENGTH=934 /DNA_ID=CAMNT_0007635981 /DNA_START=12 /DNA_END=2816 /DNA_ORIENTATION=+